MKDQVSSWKIDFEEMMAETDCQKIDRLAGVLEKLQTRNVFTWDELDVWTELVYFLCPDRLNNSSTSNDEIFDAFEKHFKQRWVDRELRASVFLLYSISVQCTVGISSRRGRLESEDSLGDAIDMRAFHFIHGKILQMHKFHENYAAVELIDLFVKHFIIHCPNRVQELFNTCEDELDCMEEVDVNSVDQADRCPLHFKVLLNLITRLYEGKTPQLVALAKQFFNLDFDHLSHFIRSMVAISSPALYVDYIAMLEALCSSQICANFLFRHFNSNHEKLYDWAGLFGTLRQYVEVFRRKLPVHQNHMQAEIEAPQMMRRQDLIAIVGWIRLATKICKHEPEARRFFVFGNHFNSVDTLVSAVTSFMPVVLKGELFKFLAVLASDENAVIQIWNILIRDSVCVFGDQPGKLVGIQTEFEEVECVNRTYDSACGFLHLVRALFSRRYLPDTKVVAPYVFFVTKTIICQCDSRSYESIQQMWKMLDIAFDCLFQFLRRFHISASTVSRRTPQVFVLSQLLSDSDLSRALVRILTECSNTLEDMFLTLGKTEYTDDYPIVLARNEAAKSGLQLLSYAINVHPALRASLRATTEGASISVAPLEAILLTPLTNNTQQSYIQMLTVFLDEQEILLPHTYYIVRILRRLAAKQNVEVHDVLLRTFHSNASAMRWIFARLMSVKVDELKEKSVDGEKKGSELRKLEVSDQDLIPFDLDGVSIARLRGELAREVLELFIEVMEVAPKQPNFTYHLFGFDLGSYQLTKTIGIDVSSQELNCLHSLVTLIELLCAEHEPYKLPYSALFDPALRLFEKFCSVNSLSNEPFLRFMRNSYGLLSKLTQSTIFQSAHDDLAEKSDENSMVDDSKVSIHLATFNRQIRGLILQLIAMDFTVAMNQGHVQIPNEYLTVLLSTKDGQSRAILWSLMYNSISASLEVKEPIYRNFEMSRVEDVLQSCMRRDLSGVQEYDVEMVHFVLNEEISSVINCDIHDIKREANEILLYCVQYNAQKRLEGSCLQVLSAWVAFINALLFFAPLPFLDLDVQEQIFNDAFIVLKDYLETVSINKEVLGGMSTCIFGLVRRLVQFTCLKSSLEHERKIALGPTLKVLIHCLTLPEYNRYSRFKTDIYGAILCLIEACTEQTASENREAIESYLKNGSTTKQNGNAQASNGGDKITYEGQLHNSILKPQQDSLEALLSRRASVVQSWTSIFGEHSVELVKVCTADIDYAPFASKILAMTCLSEILREARRTNNQILLQIRQVGLIKLILDSLNVNFSVDFSNKLHDNKSPLLFVKTLLALLLRIATCRGGIPYLTDCGVSNRLDQLLGGLKKASEFPELSEVLVLFDILKQTMTLKSLYN